MVINTRFSNVSVSSNTKIYLNRKIKSIEKLLDRDGSSIINVEILRTTRHHKKGEVYKVELHLSSSGANFYSEGEGEDLLVCMDAVKDKLAEKIKSSKTKKATLYMRGKQQIKRILRSVS